MVMMSLTMMLMISLLLTLKTAEEKDKWHKKLRQMLHRKDMWQVSSDCSFSDDVNDYLLHIADLLLLIYKNEKLIVDMSTMSSWNNSRQCYLTLHVFRNDTILNDDVTVITMMTKITFT